MKALKRMTFNIEKTVKRNDLRHIVYLKSLTYHDLYSQLGDLNADEATLVIIDDQIGFDSNSHYLLSSRIKIQFSLINKRFLLIVS